MLKIGVTAAAFAALCAREQLLSHQAAISRRQVMPVFAQAFLTVTFAAIPTLAWAECSGTAAAECRAAASKCRANCERTDRREEAVRVCHQEYHANYIACLTDARCG